MSANRTLHIWPECPRSVDGSVELRAIIETPDGNRRPLWYKRPEESANIASETHDLFLVACLFLAMHTAEKVEVHGRVSRSLLENLEEFIRAWHCWRPTIYHIPELDVEEPYSIQRTENQVVCAFSGGVDACCALFRHVTRLAGRRSRPIRNAVLVHGFDIPLADTVALEAAQTSARAIVSSLGVPLHVISTNSYEFCFNWEDAFYSQAVAAMMASASSCNGCVIGGCEPYSDFPIPWGSNPVTNPLLSSAEFSVTTDGLELGRVDKVKLIAGWPEARRNLRVCWQAGADGRNCGRCEKCIRTKLEFLCHGITTPECFPPEPLIMRDIRAVKPKNPAQLTLLREIVFFAEQNESLRTAQWVGALRQVVKRGVAIEKANIVRRLRKRLAVRTRARRLLGSLKFGLPKGGSCGL